MPARMPSKSFPSEPKSLSPIPVWFTSSPRIWSPAIGHLRDMALKRPLLKFVWVVFIFFSLATIVQLIWSWTRFGQSSPQERARRLAEFIRISREKLENSSLAADHGQVKETQMIPRRECISDIRNQMRHSEAIWRASKRKRLDSMQNMGQQFLNEPWGVHSGTLIWDLFPPVYNCPVGKMERIGKLGDGGKWVCGFDMIALRSRERGPCIVYSYGIAAEVSFEEEILQRSKCYVRMFDHTISTAKGPAVELVKKYPDQAILVGYGLGVTDTSELHTLRNEMEANGDEFIDILKIDIEGSELEVMRAIMTDFSDKLPFGQLQVELHLSSLSTGDTFLELATLIESMEAAGLRLFSVEPNQIPVFIGQHLTVMLYEYSFLNTRRLGPEYFCRVCTERPRSKVTQLSQ